MKNIFRSFSARISLITGSAYTFTVALLIIIIWATSGPIFGFSDTWQLIINTGTTIVTFLMVFLIQNTQNRDSKAMQLKLDELIRATRARDAFVDLENLSDEEIAQLDKQFHDLRDKQVDTKEMKKLHRAIQLEGEARKTGRKLSPDTLNKIIKKITDY